MGRLRPEKHKERRSTTFALCDFSSEQADSPKGVAEFALSCFGPELSGSRIPPPSTGLAHGIGLNGLLHNLC